ncbi:MAG: S9 family peptidase [Actinobacteria bacterium]|nr:S9 family peptidase [Actinomycetota bacterium]
MSGRQVLPYGTWSSPITARMLATAGIGLDDPWIEDGVVYWLEHRPVEDGRYVVVAASSSSEARDVTPPGSNARTKVHEYGGAPYWVHRGTVYFSNFADQRLYRLDPGGDPVAITPETGGRFRYSDGVLTSDGLTVICVRERHEGDGPGEVVNELAAIPADGGPARTVAGGRDFYAYPRISPDGARIAWLSWDLPDMPWDGCEVWVGDLASDCAISNERRVAGSREESIFQPSWSPAGELHFVSDRTGWWNLYREHGGEVEALHAMEAEFGWPLWELGASSYAFLGDGRIACLYGAGGVQHVGVLDPNSRELIDLDLPYDAIAWPAIVAEGATVVFVGGSATMPNELVRLDLSTRSAEVLRRTREIGFDPGYLSVPRAIEFPTEGGLTAHAHFYPPASAVAEGPPEELPPLVVMSHGGPTDESTSVFDLRKQYFTSRGFAVVDVNYGGSTGYGRQYRLRLNGNWGVVDTLDCINAAQHLVAQGLVDRSRMAIRGGSAGGYTTLCALTFHDDFAAGASLFGISDLEPFATGGTHKFESKYEETLVGPYPEAADRYRARSPIHYVDMISTPMILLQGDEDEVVPPAQSEMMVEALAAKGLPYAYLLFEGEQHGFRKAENIERAFEAELFFYSRIFGFELGDPVVPVRIHNLPERLGP